MKKWIIGLVLAALCLNLCACGGKNVPQSTDPAPDITDAPTQPTTAPPDQQEPESEKASVRVMNSEAYRQRAWERLADEYERITGTDVQIVFSWDRATLRTVSSIENLPENCVDLSTSSACAQLMNRDLTLRNDQGQVLAVANNVEVYGLVYNSTLLAKTAHTREDIGNFMQLTDVVYNITENAAAYGFSAFTRVAADDYLAMQLAPLVGDSRNLLELILNNSAPADMIDADRSGMNPLWDFVDGKAVFYLAGTREQDLLSIIGSENMGVLPIYLGNENEEKQTLCVAARSYWCVDGNAAPEEIAATLDFLEFLTTPRDDGSLPVDELEFMAPFRQATFVSNVPEQVLRSDVAQGRVPVVCPYVSQVPEGLTQALKAYAANPSNENWTKIQQILEQL